MRLTKDELLNIFIRILNDYPFLQDRMSFSCDYYHQIGEDKYDMNKPIDELDFSVGSICDDLISLKKLVSETDRSPTNVDIERLSNILQAISDDKVERERNL